MELPDVQVATLEPECVNRSSPPPVAAEPAPTPAVAATGREDSSSDLLLTIDEKEQIEQVSNQCAHILEDLTDLQFDQQEELKEEKEEFDLLNDRINEAASKRADRYFAFPR